MKIPLLTFALICFFGQLSAQQEIPPPYCNDAPSTYGSVVAPAAKPTPLPRFATTSHPEYKIQVAILRNTDPKDFPFHPTLVARYRPCEQVWVVESRESFKDRAEAEKLREQLKKLGYSGAYITDLVAYN